MLLLSQFPEVKPKYEEIESLEWKESRLKLSCSKSLDLVFGSVLSHTVFDHLRPCESSQVLGFLIFYRDHSILEHTWQISECPGDGVVPPGGVKPEGMTLSMNDLTTRGRQAQGPSRLRKRISA